MSDKLFDTIFSYLVPREIRGEGVKTGARYLKTLPQPLEREPPLCPSPIFILSAGWRSGSTLLQRIICSDGSALIWGEPFGDRIPICRLADTISYLSADDPHIDCSVDKYAEEDLSGTWVANLNPGVRYLLPSHRAYMEKLFAEPAQKRGFSRWGAKWVRLTGDHALYLQWLYPDAKFLYLVRNPIDAYHSYRGRYWYTVKPSFRMTNIVKFVCHWRYLAQSFLAAEKETRGFLIRYEELNTSSGALDRLEGYLEIKVDREVLSHKIDASAKREGLRFWERYLIEQLAGTTGRNLRYTGQME